MVPKIIFNYLISEYAQARSHKNHFYGTGPAELGPVPRKRVQMVSPNLKNGVQKLGKRCLQKNGISKLERWCPNLVKGGQNLKKWCPKLGKLCPKT